MTRNVLNLVGAVACMAFSGVAGASAAQYSITFHAGSVGGLYMEPSVVWTEQWKQAVPEATVSPILGGSMTNPLKVTTADPNSALGWTTLPLARDAMKGENDYEQRAPGGIKNLRALWRVNSLTWAEIIARPGVVPEGVSTLGEYLATKPDAHWALKTKGSGAEVLTRQLFDLYGASYDDLQNWGKVSFNNTSDAAKMIIDGHADIFANTMAMPDSSVLDMDASVPGLKWLALDEKQIDLLASEYGYIPGEHPTGSYDSLKPGLRTVAYDHVVFARADMDEDLVYKLTKAVMEHPEKTRALPSLSEFDPKVAWQHTGFPLHPGAERAYRELGLMPEDVGSKQ